jgi:probable rRNA maturation factor
MLIYFDEDIDLNQQLADRMQESAVLCALEEALDPSRLTLSVSFVDALEIRRLNLEYRGKDETTDVLSFPQFDEVADLPGSGEISLGDVVICREAALRQASEYGHSPEREILYLFTHSVFHLLGYDHIKEADQKEMREKEERVMEKLNLARTHTGGDILG